MDAVAAQMQLFAALIASLAPELAVSVHFEHSELSCVWGGILCLLAIQRRSSGRFRGEVMAPMDCSCAIRSPRVTGLCRSGPWRPLERLQSAGSGAQGENFGVPRAHKGCLNRAFRFFSANVKTANGFLVSVTITQTSLSVSIGHLAALGAPEIG